MYSTLEARRPNLEAGCPGPAELLVEQCPNLSPSIPIRGKLRGADHGPDKDYSLANGAGKEDRAFVDLQGHL